MMNIETAELIAKYFYLKELPAESLVEWAGVMLEAGLDCDNLCILAGFNVGPLLDRNEVEDYFYRCLKDLGWRIPPMEDSLFRYVNIIAERIASDEISPVTGCEQIYQIHRAFGDSNKLKNWLYLSDGLDPVSFADLFGEQLDNAIRREARKLLGQR